MTAATSRAPPSRATEQIKAAMGVDLPAIARRLERAETTVQAPVPKARPTDGPEKGKGPA